MNRLLVLHQIVWCSCLVTTNITRIFQLHMNRLFMDFQISQLCCLVFAYIACVFDQIMNHTYYTRILYYHVLTSYVVWDCLDQLLDKEKCHKDIFSLTNRLLVLSQVTWITFLIPTHITWMFNPFMNWLFMFPETACCSCLVLTNTTRIFYPFMIRLNILLQISFPTCLMFTVITRDFLTLMNHHLIYL